MGFAGEWGFADFKFAKLEAKQSRSRRENLSRIFRQKALSRD